LPIGQGFLGLGERRLYRDEIGLHAGKNYSPENCLAVASASDFASSAAIRENRKCKAALDREAAAGKPAAAHLPGPRALPDTRLAFLQR
jgi:hypothetical protein